MRLGILHGAGVPRGVSHRIGQLDAALAAVAKAALDAVRKIAQSHDYVIHTMRTQIGQQMLEKGPVDNSTIV